MLPIFQIMKMLLIFQIMKMLLIFQIMKMLPIFQIMRELKPKTANPRQHVLAHVLNKKNNNSFKHIKKTFGKTYIT